MSRNKMTWDEFEQRYKPMQNHLDDNAALDGHMYETYGPELLHIHTCISDRVWTYVEGGDGKPVLVNGYWLVNRLGYVVTELAHDEGEDLLVVDQ